MRILIVKLSSLGDVVHAMPVVADIRQAHPEAAIDWVVEPAFAALLRRVDGIADVIECPLRRWRRGWWTGGVRAEWRAFKVRLRHHHYDAVLDLQGLTKSAVIARVAHGVSHGLANRTDGASFEAPAGWLVDHAIRIEARTHALDRSRQLAATALGYAVQGPPRFGLGSLPLPFGEGHREAKASDSAAAHRPGALGEMARPTVVFVHGSSRDDKLWPEAAWIGLGQRLVAQGWRIALPHVGSVELERATRLQHEIGDAAEVWPQMNLDALTDRMAGTQGVVGVDSGLSHVAVALDLPHVQIYNFPTAWRTGPLAAHGHRHQVSVEAEPSPSLDAVWAAWCGVAGEAGR